MSSDACANSGYLIKVTDEVIKNLNLNNRANLIKNIPEDCINRNCYPNIHECSIKALLIIMANEYIPLTIKINKESFTVSFFIYSLDNGSQYDDLEDGELYMTFIEEELFEMKPTKVSTDLSKLNLSPFKAWWVTYG